MNLKLELERRSKIIDQALDSFLPRENVIPSTIHKAVRYSTFAGGKRLRPILVMGAAEAVGGDIEKVIPTACAIEMIHTYSLIHDDLPALDNDDYRRGQLTNHKVFGEDIAILAGDALLTQAFYIIAESCLKTDIDPALGLRVIAEVGKASGTQGMIGGQVVDLESENKSVGPETLQYIHNNKTGALFRVSLRAGAILAGASEEEIENLSDYADNFGLAFQITDDILDVVGDAKVLGKPVGSDLKNHKATYPSLFGLDKSREMARSAINSSLKSLLNFGEKGELLRHLALYLSTREY